MPQGCICEPKGILHFGMAFLSYFFFSSALMSLVFTFRPGSENRHRRRGDVPHSPFRHCKGILGPSTWSGASGTLLLQSVEDKGMLTNKIVRTKIVEYKNDHITAIWTTADRADTVPTAWEHHDLDCVAYLSKRVVYSVTGKLFRSNVAALRSNTQRLFRNWIQSRENGTMPNRHFCQCFGSLSPLDLGRSAEITTQIICYVLSGDHHCI